MSLWGWLNRGKAKHTEPRQTLAPDSVVLSGGDLINKITDGAYTIDGKPLYEWADEKKHDIDFMKRCCVQILQSPTGSLMPAPYYFQRVAILSRKQKDYEQEILYCEKYIELVKSISLDKEAIDKSLKEWEEILGKFTPKERARRKEIEIANEQKRLSTQKPAMIEPFEKRLVKARFLLEKSRSPKPRTSTR